MSRSLVPVVSKLARINYAASSQCVRFFHPPADFKRPTLNDLPVPCGSWQEDYERKNKKYTMHLAFGLGWLAFTLFVAKQSGLFFFNFYPPERPADKIEDYNA